MQWPSWQDTRGGNPFWGAPLLSKTGGIWGAAPGGAALLVREKWPAKQAQRDPGCTLSEELWNSGRWLHVIVTPADGKRPRGAQHLCTELPGMAPQGQGWVRDPHARHSTMLYSMQESTLSPNSAAGLMKHGRASREAT